MRGLSYLLLVCFFLFPSSLLHARIIHVPTDSVTIQGGINGAMDGDTVMVSPGTYYEHDIDFLGKAITVMGTDPEDSSVVESTVVDANSQGKVFYFQSGEDTTSVLSGLTITGGGISCRYLSSPMISNNLIIGNQGGNGGGICCDNSSNPRIFHNAIIGNSGNHGGGSRVLTDRNRSFRSTPFPEIIVRVGVEEYIPVTRTPNQSCRTIQSMETQRNSVAGSASPFFRPLSSRIT